MRGGSGDCSGSGSQQACSWPVLWQSLPIMCAGNDFIRWPCRSLLPGNCSAARDWREDWSREREGEKRERGAGNEALALPPPLCFFSFFYLASDGEIQINSCQSGGPQGEGLRRRWAGGWGEGVVGAVWQVEEQVVVGWGGVGVGGSERTGAPLM